MARGGAGLSGPGSLSVLWLALALLHAPAPSRLEPLPVFRQHCPAIHADLMEILFNSTTPGNTSLEQNYSRSLPTSGFPFLLHFVGQLHPDSHTVTQQLIQAKADACEIDPSPRAVLSPVIVGLPNRTSLPAGHTHAFLVDMGSCEESTEVLQATLAGAAGRVRVRFNSLPHGLALGFFHPVEAGDYTLVVHRHFLLPKENRSFRHHYEGVVLDRVPFTVAPADPLPPANLPLNPCGPGPFAGRWVSLNASCHPPHCVGDNTQVVNSSWVYVPYDCYLSLRCGLDVTDCLQGKWVLFHGDSTMEENALGFVKDLLRAITPMKKQRRGDPWRNFDVLVAADGNVSHFPPDSGLWANQSAVGTASIRITMRFNPSPHHNGEVYRRGDCTGLMTYTHHCRLTQELLDQFSSERPPDVFVFGSQTWDMHCVPLPLYRTLLQEMAGLFRALHALSPGTRFLFRSPYGPLTWYQGHPTFGVTFVERYLQVALDVMGRLPFVRVVDLYDVVQPWAKESEFAGDGLHLSVTEGSQFLHRHVLQLLLHEICVPPATADPFEND